MHIFDVLEIKWNNRKQSDSTIDIRRRSQPHESFSVWERRFVMYWKEVVPKWAKDYMREHPDTLIITRGGNKQGLGLLDNPMYFLFGTLGWATADLKEQIHANYWAPKKMDKYKMKTLNKGVQETFKNLQVEETTYALKVFGITKVFIDLEFPKKTKDITDLLRRFLGYGWKFGEVVHDIPGSPNHLYLTIYRNSYN